MICPAQVEYLDALCVMKDTMPWSSIESDRRPVIIESDRRPVIHPAQVEYLDALCVMKDTELEKL